MLAWAGIDFGEDNNLRLQKSIKVSVMPMMKPELIQNNAHIRYFCFVIEIGNYERSCYSALRRQDLWYAEGLLDCHGLTPSCRRRFKGC